MDILAPLDLPVKILNDVLLSVHDTAARIRNSETSARAHPIHLVLFASPIRSPEGQPWGFFRIEKIENAEEGAINPSHTVEFYLYVEPD